MVSLPMFETKDVFSTDDSVGVVAEELLVFF